MTPLADKDGRVVALSISDRKGIKKHNVNAVELRVEHGLANDAHAGSWHRQVSLLGVESIGKIQAKGLDVAAGDFAENITTEGICLWQLPVGSRFRIGEGAVVEVTQIGKTCHHRCEIFLQVGDCVMPREGIFARVLEAGTIRPGDTISLA
jgi:MOSC domain-containing protein YiiM